MAEISYSRQKWFPRGGRSSENSADKVRFISMSRITCDTISCHQLTELDNSYQGALIRPPFNLLGFPGDS